MGAPLHLSQLPLFLAVTGAYHRPLVVAYGVGVDSTAMLVGFVQKGIRPDAILFANVGGENEESYAFLPIMNAYLRAHGFPEIVVVQYQAQNFKHYPPYHSLEENCLTNGTLPSEAFGFGSCSQKWKAAPQKKWLESWQPAIECWARGEKVIRAIGFDASGADQKRTYAAEKIADPRFEYWYPLQEWGWDRQRCITEIKAAGLPVPPKSSCFFCPNMKPAEVRGLSVNHLQRIVLIEARARPRLEGFMSQEELDEGYAKRLEKWNRAGRVGKEPRRRMVGDPGLVKGLWRTEVKGTRGRAEKKPARMSDFIRSEGLLPAELIGRIEREAPKELIDRAEAFANGLEVDDWADVLGGLDRSCGGVHVEACVEVA